MLDFSDYSHCTLCPRNCRVNRNAGETGVCGETAEMRITSISAHFGEEPPISGTRGSGTVFFSGCAMQCRFCQNYDISCLHVGDILSVQQVVKRLRRLYQQQGIHNVNFVAPDHFLPHTIEIVKQLRKHQVPLPILYNTSGYMKVDKVDALAGVADMFMPDFKFADAELARQQARAGDYPEIALQALQRMVHHAGFLDVPLTDRTPARSGVLVRHLVLPGYVQNSIDVLDLLHSEFGKDIPINLMSQFWPARRQADRNLNRRLNRDEFEAVAAHARDLGFSNLLIQTM